LRGDIQLLGKLIGIGKLLEHVFFPILLVLQSSASKFSVALLHGSMANRRRQAFRLVRATALRLVWSGVLRVPLIRMLGAYNRALASGCVRVNGCERVTEKVQLCLMYVVGWATFA
jgi:hypothetical protein